jgi:hypothetical protein
MRNRARHLVQPGVCCLAEPTTTVCLKALTCWRLLLFRLYLHCPSRTPQLKAFFVAAALRNVGPYRELLTEAASLAANFSLPPAAALPLFLAHGAPAPRPAAEGAAAALAALRRLLPAAAPCDLVALLSHPGARLREGRAPEAPAASLAAAADVLGLTPYRVLQILLRDAARAQARRGRAGGAPGGAALLAAAASSAAPEAPPQVAVAPPAAQGGGAHAGGGADRGESGLLALGAPGPRARCQFSFLLAPPERLRARAAAVSALLGVEGPAAAALLRENPILLAYSSERLESKARSLASFMTGVQGGGRSGSGSGGGDIAAAAKPVAAGGAPPQQPGLLEAAAWDAARAALRRCPRLLGLEVATCAERVRALGSALGLPPDAAWTAARRAPALMAQPRDRLAAAAAWLSALAGGTEGARAVVKDDPKVLIDLGLWGKDRPPPVLQGGAALGRGGCGSTDALAAVMLDGGGGGCGGDGDGGSNSDAPVRPAAAASRLAWLARTLGVPEGDALAAAVRSHAGRYLLFHAASAAGEARVAALAGLLGLEAREVLATALERGLTYRWAGWGAVACRGPQSALSTPLRNCA